MAKTLVTYFSATGTTKDVATRLARVADGDLFAIVPANPYTSADLDWRDKQSRSTLEAADPSCRPAMTSRVEHIEDYDIIFLGFPIWWYVAPAIVNTFLESYDLTGKTIVLFATSGGSGMGKTASILRASAPGAKIVDGGVLNNVSDTELEKLAEKEPVKATMLALLAEKYGMEEEDFLSSELEVVPAGRARELGFDRSMVLGYGHDDRVCAFPSLVAQLEASDLEKTGICILVDKEEIGSVGATGMTSMFFENTIAELMDLAGQAGDLPLRRCLANSSMLSSDVSAGFDPSYASAFETKNAAYLGRGVVFNKFTGARGKSGSNDANAEYMAKIRSIMDKGNAAFQTAELGRVDVGGGGTIAYILAEYGMNVIDCGVPVLSMHAPWEVVDKADMYEALKAYRAFLKYA